MANSDKKGSGASKGTAGKKPAAATSAVPKSGTSAKAKGTGAKATPNRTDAKGKAAPKSVVSSKVGASKAAPAKTIDAKAIDAKPVVTKPDAKPAPIKPAAEKPKPEAAKPEGKAKPAEKPAPVAAPKPAAKTAEKPAESRSNGLLGGILGGILAAAIGFAAARYIIPEGWPVKADTDEIETTLTAQGEAMTGLTAQVEALKSAAASTEATDALGTRLDGVETAATTNQAALETAIKVNTEALAGIETRLTALEKRPIAEGPDPAIAAAVSAYNKEIVDLRAEVAEQMAAMQGIVDAAEASKAEAAEQKAAAEAAEVKARQQQALADIIAALDSGAPFANALPALEGIDLPAALTDLAETGAPTLGSLQSGLPPLARKALDVARRESPPEDGNGISSFMRRQLGVRSLEPQEGDSPDAVLSRVEAAAAQARIADALSEAEALPEGAKGILADWLASAQARLDALSAADAVATSLTPN